MSEPVSEQPEYIPDPEKEKQARAIHFTVSIIRMLGLALLMLGIAIALDRLPPVPAPAGYVLIILGLAQMWVAPIWIVRKYVQARVAEEEIAKAAASNDDS
ncbi:hypothetical protein A8B75_11225 [Sphingomonadales bacterium EhC05]|jgi:hypothetical protein|uniref:hypothetical protein n=1 Tax=Parasphingorhabdus sp. TaxID=2709688 RepID=UPI0007F38CB0|nr:hypothetical protein A8B75_11225 [Sphingomonadales bacterium EhC05]